MWNLEGAGRGYRVLGSVTQSAHEAYGHLVAAQHALAETDFTTSDTEFTAAQKQLQEAQQLLSDALASSKIILQYVDVTGTVRSGQQLLTAGTQLTIAGQHASRAAGRLLNVDVLAPSPAPGGTMVDALSYALEEFTFSAEALQLAESALAKVDPQTLPDDVQQSIMRLQDVVPRAHDALTALLDQSQSILIILGARQSRQYLILFENNHEIRPTGGFIGSIGLLNIDRGVVENINVQSVYDPDGQLKEFIAPPNPLTFITNRWYLRDTNWFVDYRTTAQKVAAFFEKEGGPTVDGVMAMTPEVIKELLKVTGPIEVPAFNITVDHENFVVLTQDQVTYTYDKEKNQPKEFLSELTPILLSRLFAAPADSTLQVLGALGTAITEKQLLIYFRDPQLQEKMHRLGWDGAFPAGAQGFLSVNNANIGGHKSDQFITQEIDYRADVRRDGDVEATVTIRRTHNGPTEKIDYDYPPDEDPAFKNNIVYQRVFVPEGALLLEASGFTPAVDIPRVVNADPAVTLVPDPDVALWQQAQSIGSNGTAIGQEAGYTYFANWTMTQPGGTSVGVYRYRLSQHAALPGLLDTAKNFRLYVAKQPGDTRTTLRLEVRLPEGNRIRHTVPNSGVTQSTATVASYRGALQHDQLFGVVFSHQ